MRAEITLKSGAKVSATVESVERMFKSGIGFPLIAWENAPKKPERPSFLYVDADEVAAIVVIPEAGDPEFAKEAPHA